MPSVFTPILCILTVPVVMVSATTLKVTRQRRVATVECLSKLRGILDPRPHLMVPFLDRIRYILDTCEGVMPFPPQDVTTEDNLVVPVDSVIYFQVVDPAWVAYEAQNYRAAIEQLTMTTLRNIIGGMGLETTLTSREEINSRLCAVLDKTASKWGIKVSRVELRAIGPPPTIRDTMEKSARAERDKRASIPLAEGQCQSQIPPAGGDRGVAILRARGDYEAAVFCAQADRQAQMLRTEGETQVITTVFSAIHAVEPDQALLAYQYMQTLPRLANNGSNKTWIVPSGLSDILKDSGQATSSTNVWDYASQVSQHFSIPEPVDVYTEIAEQAREDHEQSDATVKQAIANAQTMEGMGSSRRLGQPSPQPQRQDPDSPGAWGSRPGGSYDTQ